MLRKNKINRSAKSGKFVTEKFAKKHKSTTTTETIVPKNANTFRKVCKMKRDNVSTKNSWILIESGHVNIANQKRGGQREGFVSLTKREFERFIRFYETGK